MTKKNSVKPSTVCFKKLYDITAEWCSIPGHINYKSVVQMRIERWNILLDIWKKNSRRVGRNIFLNPLVHIFTGEYLTHNGTLKKKLFGEIEEALINSSEIFEIWFQTKDFQDAINEALIRTYKLTTFAQFQVSQGMLRLLKGKDISIIEKSKFVQRHGYLKITDFSYLMNVCSSMKARMALILPDSQSWSIEQWRCFSFVSDAINAKYNLNISIEWNLQGLLDLTDYAICSNMQLDYECISTAHINYKFAKTIFGNRTETVILDLFNKSKKILLDEYDLSFVTGSWMYTILYEWVCDKSHPYHNQAKKTIFDTMFCCSQAAVQ